MRSSVVTWQPELARAAIRETGMTVREVAIRADLVGGSLHGYLYGGTRPSPAVLVRLADVLDVPTTNLAPLRAAPTLHEHRWHTGLTVAELAVGVGLSADRAGSILRGFDRPTDPARWASALGLTADQVLEAWRNTRAAVVEDG